MEIVTLAQGSPEWLAHRSRFFNASDAPSMLGVSPHKTRRQLLAELSTGVTPEVDPATQRRFNNGHRLEALARPLAEEIVGEPLYPVTGTSGQYSASFDGLTIGGETAFEHKALNAALRAVLSTGQELPLHYRVQIEHQLLVSGAERCLFVASDWDSSGTLLAEFHRWVKPDAELRSRIVAGWEQFARDLETFAPAPPSAPAATAVGTAPETLPALRIEVEGTVIASNLVAFRETAIAAVRAVKRDLSTDQDFADAEMSVKWCREVEARIEAAKAHALAQTASIDELFRALDSITDEARRVRLDLEKRVKVRKDEIRLEIVRDAQRALAKHVSQLSAELSPHRLPDIRADFGGAIKGKRSIESMHDAVDSTLAAARIEADGVARVMRANLAVYREAAAGRDFLFHDIAAHLLRPEAEFREWVDGRIERHRVAVLEQEARAAEEITRNRLLAEAAATAAAEAAAREAAAIEVAPPPVAAQPIPMPEAGAPADGEPELSLTDMNARLGVSLSAVFVSQTLGIHPAGKRRAALLFTESQFDRICRGLVSHVEAVRTRHAKTSKTRQKVYA